MQRWLGAVRAQSRAGVSAPYRALDVTRLLDEMRLVKDDDEIAIMRAAARISAGAHVRAMRFTRPGCHEYEVEAELLHEFRRHGSEFPAYGSIVALFGVLLGGWLIASEYQQGTIRLLMIRPKTRTKILLSKFLAALLVWLAVDLIGSTLNLLTNGILFGFSDFAYPNYTVAGEIGFIAYYLPKLLACILPILFAFAIAFMLSVLVKNIAISIAVPIVIYIGSIIVMNIFAYQDSMAWIAYTPLPFLQMSSFFSRYSNIQYIIQRGINLNITFGVLQLLVLSALFTGIAVYVFKKRDIVN